MLTDEQAKEELGLARARWIEASRIYALAIQRVLAEHGPDFDHIRQMDLNGPDGWLETSRYDEELAGNDPPGDSPLASRYIRVVELLFEMFRRFDEGKLTPGVKKW